jgi:predicted secreted Zn-dependent protease
LVITVSTAPRRGCLGLAHAVADHLAAAELHFFAIGGEVLLDLDEELGVGKADLVADGRAEHGGIGEREILAGIGDPRFV